MASHLDHFNVHALPGDPSHGMLVAGNAAMRCALGRGGIAPRKREGDGVTPAGIFPLRRLYFRPDRVPRPASGLPVTPIDPGLGWSEDPRDPSYNRPVRLPHRFARESMCRDDGLYDYIVVLGHNDAPVLAGAGSAIFLHLARPRYAPTEGCVAVSRADMRRLLPRLGPRTRIVIGA